MSNRVVPGSVKTGGLLHTDAVLHEAPRNALPDIADELVVETSGESSKLFDGNVLITLAADEDDLILLGCPGDIRDVHHELVHTYSAEDRGLFP